MTTPVPLPPHTSTRRTPGLAVAALVLGIVSLVGGSILVVPAILAIVFGHISYGRIKKDASLTGEGLALAGFVLGYVSIVVGLLMAGLLAAMAVPAFKKVREASLEKAMANDARHIAAAAQQFMLEETSRPVKFEVDPETGKVSGPLARYVPQLMRGVQQVDGVFESDSDGFSLRHPSVQGGRECVFDAEGRLVTTR
ncbi:MAG TPA: DUF4190 domain-containing protein [Opitutaceae bacterium]|nr:DUF4190 domain-containing protein [Opitutaceae bacterium]